MSRSRSSGPETMTVVDRYTTGTRINHWLTAASLILLALSGLALFHPSLFFLTLLFGGGEWTRILHPWVGIVLFFSFLGLFLRFWSACLLRREDGTWMLKFSDYISNRENDSLPEMGTYNPGQKLYFWAMSVLIIVLIVSGLIAWDQYFDTYTSIGVKRLALLVHSGTAVVAICAFIVHVSMVIWERGTLRAMTRGSVTGGWGWKHHRKWLREQVAKGEVHSAESGS